MSRIAGPPYRDPVSQWHGPCYVLDPEHYAHGWREVLAVIPAIPPKPRRGGILAVPRRVHRLSDPSWHNRARELRAEGLSIRAIMRVLEVHSYGTMYRVLYL